MEDNPQEILKELIKSFGEGVGKEVTARLLERLEKAINFHRYGFSVNSEIADYLATISKKDIFVRLKDCVGSSHWALPYCRVGLLIDEFNEQGKEIDIQSIKNEAYRKKRKSVTVINMGTTKVIKDIILYLSELKSEDYTKEELAEEFDYIIDGWDRITVFVKKEESVSDISDKILRFMTARERLFWVFGYASAAKIGWSATSKLNNLGEFHKHSYVFFSDNQKDGQGLPKFSCRFKLC